MKENAQASEGQFDEVRNCVIQSFNKLRGRMDANVADGWIVNSKSLDLLLERMIPTQIEESGHKPDIHNNHVCAIFEEEIDYSRSIANYVVLGKYDSVDKQITDDNFPSTETGKVMRKLILLHFNRDLSSKQAIPKIIKAGCRSACMKELLTFGERYPQVQKDFPIVALGSVAQLGSDKFVGCLYSHEGDRRASLRYDAGSWGDHFRYLAVRE